jgi:hypothetical protein
MSIPTKSTPLATKFRILAVLVAALAASGCNNTIGPDAGRSLAPGLPAFSASDNSTWIRSSMLTDVTYFVPCLGENLHLYGPTFFQYHEVTSNSGNTEWHVHLLAQTPNLPPFTATGQSTGRVFTYNYGHPINTIFHLGPGQVVTALDKETYTGSDGTILSFTYHLHITVNANGVVTVEREVPPGGAFSCK